uniref:YdeI/OmpD-associated family protein n=1 Tax=Fulvivirga sp. TaxID=1931237 RepID=UPI0040498FBB
MKTLSSTIEKFDSNLWHYHIPLPEDVALSFIEGDNKRVICTVNQIIQFHAAILKASPYYFILINTANLKKLGVDIHDKVTVTIEKDHSEYGHQMTEEMEAVFDQDDEGFAYFKALTKGKQRSLIYLASQVKNSQSRINKALAIMDHLKQEKGVLAFKKLNETIKKYNQRSKLH